MTRTFFGDLSGLWRPPAGGIAPDAPLIVAIHGGTYTSAYFDVPGYSLLDAAEANGIPVLALDRPGHGHSPSLPPPATIKTQAQYLTPVLQSLWERHGQGTRGIVLIGHSIGGAIAATIASAPENLPLLGLAISGVGLRTPSGHKEQWDSLPNVEKVDLPTPLKDQLMFGPAGSFAADMPAASHVANAQALRAELVDIVSTWHLTVRDTLARITIPVHYRQAEIDHLWIVDDNEITDFARALKSARWVDAALVHGTGHCLDFHYIGKALQLQQLAFACQCSAESRYIPGAFPNP
jgi:pimeloyl-ACP methyl ester carboxylesterase